MRALLFTLMCICAGACGDDTSPVGGADLAAPASDLARGAPDLGCYPNPTTHAEIINACTTAQAVDKTPVTPLLNPDGSLPPLP